MVGITEKAIFAQQKDQKLMYRKFLASILTLLGFSACCHEQKCLYGPPALYGPPVDDSIPIDTVRPLYGTKTRSYMSPDELIEQNKDSIPEQQEQEQQ